jgi:hypothetical protein
MAQLESLGEQVCELELHRNLEQMHLSILNGLVNKMRSDVNVLCSTRPPMTWLDHSVHSRTGMDEWCVQDGQSDSCDV